MNYIPSDRLQQQKVSQSLFANASCQKKILRALIHEAL